MDRKLSSHCHFQIESRLTKRDVFLGVVCTLDLARIDIWVENKLPSQANKINVMLIIVQQ
jgi:hypothetical protein